MKDERRDSKHKDPFGFEAEHNFCVEQDKGEPVTGKDALGIWLTMTIALCLNLFIFAWIAGLIGKLMGGN